ncbi:MAG: RHS repeat-associated core domain-containing protein [Ruminococcaceae bacterium]|nr:RHS repeat-associated core domain-containing protein [Oscillospiraceae bacterium]
MKKLAKKIISVFLAASIALQIAVSAYAEAGVDLSDVFSSDSDLLPPEEYSEEEYTEEPKVLIGELTDKRTETTKHFLYSNGTIEVAQYGVAVHYLDENGEWQDIDNSLISEAATDDEDDFAGYVNKENNVKIKFSNGNSSGKFFKYEKDGCKLTWGLNKADLNGKFSIAPKVLSDTENEYALHNVKSSVKYSSVMENVDISYEISGSDIKENIIVNDKLSSYNFTFDIKAKKLDLELGEDGSISITKEDGTPFAYIPAPFMYDSNNEYSSDVSFSLEEYKNDRYYLTVTASEEWMNEEGREFPVVIDPAIVQSGSDVSGSFISSAFPNANYSTWDNLLVGNHESSGNTRAYIKLTLPELEKSDVVVDAQFSIYQGSSVPTSFTAGKMYVYRINEDWDPATLTWNNRPAFQITISDYTEFNATAERKEVNITGMVREWYSGVPNYGLVLKADNEDGSLGSVSFAKSVSSSYDSTMLPYLMVSYRSNKGLEGYWGYHAVGASAAGTAYINDFSGNLVFTNTIVADSGNRMPLSMGLVYDGFRAKEQFRPATSSSNTKFSSMNFGLGWKLSLEECILPVTDANMISTYKYMYVDSDGTEHYFYQSTADDGSTVYLDEDGLSLTLTVLSGGGYKLTDKDDNYKQFNSSGLLTVISDANGNKNTLTYTNGRITSVTDGAGRATTLAYSDSGYLTSVTNTAGKTTTFTYSSGYLTKVTYPDSTYASYAYDTANSGVMLSTHSSEDAYKLYFTYSSLNNINRVTAYEEKVQTGSAYVAGQSAKIEYGGSDLYTVYTFMGGDNTIDTDDDIRTVYIFDDLGRTVSSYSTDKNGKTIHGAGANTYESAEKSGKTNKISTQSVIGGVNPNLLTGHQCESATGWTSAYVGTNNSSLTRTVDSTTKYLGAGSIKLLSNSKISGSLAGYKQTVTLEADTKYYLSGYILTENISGTGACLAVSNPGTTAVAFTSEYVNGTTDKAINDGWQRVSFSFTSATAGTYTIYFGLENCTGTAYFDCLQLEKSEYLSNANLLENAKMESTSKWSATNGYSVATGLDGNGLALTGNPSGNRAIYQDVYLYTPANTTYVLSGWVKASSVDIRESRKLRLRAKIYYTDNTTETHFASFLSSTDEWQFASVNIVPKKTLDVKAIRVCCDYDYNCNTAIFDNLSLIKDTVKSYTYDDDGNTVSAVDNAQDKFTFEYQDNDLVKQNNPTGYSYNYTYDSKHNLLTAKSENDVTYTFTYDAYGNPLTMKQANSAGDLYINSSATYTTNGNYLATLTDARGYTSNYTYNANSGLLTKFTDALDNSTIYAYNLNNNRITSVAYDANKNGVGDGTESIVNYAYSKGRLSTITHNGFNYGFTYDNFGNMVTTTVGGNALVTNTYGSNNGMLTKSAYGNGYNLLYTYDKFNRVIAEKQGSNALNRFYYDNNGNLATVTDGENGIEYNYEYDFIGRLVRSFATKNSADYLTSQITYDEFNRISAQNYILANGTNHNYKYEYSEKDNLIETVTLPYSRGIIYNYDSLNRPTTKTIAGGTAGISESYTYFEDTDTNATSSLVSRITYNNGKYLQYTYNEVNNITAVLDTNGGKRTGYSYDGLGQLIREDNPYTSKTYVYAYDKGGNITSVKTYAYTTSSTLGTPTSTITYTYGDSAWKDKLTSYNGTAITYDSIGNPLSYRNGTLAWTGRQLKSHTSTNGTTTIYTYNSDGVRIGKKSVYQGNTSETSYVVSGTTILSETKGSTTNYYIYDEKGLPIGLVYNGTTYTYRKNIQGDIIAILDSTGAEVVTYTYNAWGAVEDISGSLETTLGVKNPFRYRGYYYDTETGYYYLNSRYYDPITGRFLNEDGFVSTGQGLLGYNMFAYCGNNPVMRVDPNGDIFFLALIYAGLTSGGIFGAGATSVISASGPETEYADPITRAFITVKSGSSVNETIASVGDSSKPISVYAEGRVDSPLESSAGLKFNLFGCSLNISLGLGRTGVGLTVPNGEQTQTHFIGADLAELKLGYEVSVTKPIDSNKINVEKLDFTSVGITGRSIAALIMAYYTGTSGPFLQPIPMR